MTFLGPWRSSMVASSDWGGATDIRDAAAPPSMDFTFQRTRSRRARNGDGDGGGSFASICTQSHLGSRSDNRADSHRINRAAQFRMVTIGAWMRASSAGMMSRSSATQSALIVLSYLATREMSSRSIWGGSSATIVRICSASLVRITSVIAHAGCVFGVRRLTLSNLQNALDAVLNRKYRTRRNEVLGDLGAVHPAFVQRTEASSFPVRRVKPEERSRDDAASALEHPGGI